MKNLFYIIRSYRTSPKSPLVLTQKLIDIAVGLMLGDLHAELKTPRNYTRLQFKQSSKHLEYFQHLYQLFIEYVGSIPKELVVKGGLPHMGDTLYLAIKFNTLSLTCFNMFREFFYDPQGVKILPHNIDVLLTDTGLAYWFKDDGYFHRKCFAFCTESFTQEKNERLVKILKDKFDLDCLVTPHTNGPRLYVKASSRDKFIELVKPHLIPLFYYKLGIKSISKPPLICIVSL